MKAKSVTIRLDESLVKKIDDRASGLPYKNRTFVIERALWYALENPPSEGILNYKRKEPDVLHTGD